MMMRKFIISLLALVAVVSLFSCNKEIKPKRPIVDQPGVVFIDGGRRDTVNTDITPAQLREALIANDWEFSYSFYYDDYSIGYKGEDVYYSRFVYHFNEDGTAVATDLRDSKTYDYKYTLNARMVTLTNANFTFTFGVIAMDKRHMIADQSLKGQYAGDYDPATLTRRMIFLAR